jgi:hypothetical protein
MIFLPPCSKRFENLPQFMGVEPAMGYFTPKEKDDMLQDFWTFDRNLIHEKYKQMVEKFESG